MLQLLFIAFLKNLLFGFKNARYANFAIFSRKKFPPEAAIFSGVKHISFPQICNFPQNVQKVRNFLDISTIERLELQDILARGMASKRSQSPKPKPMTDRTLVMIFEKPSTRTRVSFQVGMQQLGGMVVTLGETESQLGRGETLADTAQVLSRYADIIMIRTDDHQKLMELAEYSTVQLHAWK